MQLQLRRPDMFPMISVVFSVVITRFLSSPINLSADRGLAEEQNVQGEDPEQRSFLNPSPQYRLLLDSLATYPHPPGTGQASARPSHTCHPPGTGQASACPSHT